MTYLINPATGSIDTKDNWIAEMKDWGDDAQAQFDSLVEIPTCEVPDYLRLQSYGFALFGRSWQSQVADALKVDRRRITHWIQGTRPVPHGVWHDLQKLAIDRLEDIKEAAEGNY